MKNTYTSNTWQILYNFNCQPGQGWANTFKDNTTTPVHNYVRVDSTDHVIINGISLKRLYVNYKNDVHGSWGAGYSAQIIERIGCTSFMFNYECHQTSTDDDSFDGFLCYRDNAFGLKQFSDKPCEYRDQVGLDEEGEGDGGVIMYPNPVSDFLNVEVKDTDLEKYVLSLTDLQGRELKRIPIKEKDKIDLSDLKNGMYLITVSQSKKVIYKKKFIKE